MIFVDTGAWYASLVPTDPDYGRAVQWLAANHSPLFTTDYVIDETLTLLRVRGERKRALLLGARFFNHELAKIHKITDADLTLAWRTLVSLQRCFRSITFINSEQFTSCPKGVRYATHVRYSEYYILVDADDRRLCRECTGAE